MAQIRELKNRMKAVGNIQRITKTMQMIATARFSAAQRRATASKPYARKIAELVGELAATAGDSLTHPLLGSSGEKAGKSLLLVITSNRGLCGGYNGNVLRTTARFIDAAAEKLDVELVGKKGQGYFKFNRRPVAKFHGHFGDQPSYENVEQLAEHYMKVFEEKQYDAVYVSYMSFVSMSRQQAKVMRLLPMEDPTAGAAGKETAKAKQASVDYDFSPEPAALLDELLPITVKTTLFQAFNEAVVSEQIARMVAMKAATDAAGKMKKALSLKYNRARQAAITTELTEIISGVAALEK